MMQGIVDQNCEATIRLAVGNRNGQRQMIDAVIDTGFSGFLTLPSTILEALGLQAYRREVGTLGDGSNCVFDVHRGLVIWDGVLRSIDINESETAPLVGMGLLYGYRMQIDVVESGLVIISELPR
ncbi:MAG: clan AA aspartic protease [Phormidesmis sp.]